MKLKISTIVTPCIVVLLIAVLLRLPSLWTPILDVDEAIFSGFANSILGGGVPYLAALDNKPPGIYLFYAAVFFVFGKNNMIAVHALTIICAWFTAIFCARIARRFGGEKAGLWAAIFYAVFTTVSIPKFIATSIAIVMMLPLTASIDAALEWERSGKTRNILISGLLCGCACIFKFQAGINLFVMAAYLFTLRPIWFGRGIMKTSCKGFAVFVLGCVVTGGIVVSWLVAVGAWDAFVFWVVKEGSLNYIANAAKLSDCWGMFAKYGGTLAAGMPLVLWFSGAQCVRLARDLMRRQLSVQNVGAFLVFIWLVLSIIPVCIGGKFYPHYFLQLFPALCILAGWGAQIFWERNSLSARKFERRVLAALFVAGLILPAALPFAARVKPDRINAIMDEEDPYIYRPIGEYIRARTENGNRIFVWGYAAPIYYFSDRDLASRFIHCDPLTGRISGTPSAYDPKFDSSPYSVPMSWDLLFNDLRKNKPIYFVDTSPGRYHNYGKYPVTAYSNLVDFLKYNYHFEASVNNAYLYRLNFTPPSP